MSGNLKPPNDDNSFQILPIPSGTNVLPSDEAGANEFNFDKLKLIEMPNSPMNSEFLPQTLEDCEGYLDMLPLKRPNADEKNLETVADMINILTYPSAAESFAKAERQHTGGASPTASAARRNNAANADVYNYEHSAVMQEQLSLAKKRISHITAPGMFGHIVQPGCISLYNRDGKTFAVTEGRYWLPSIEASWVAKNVPLEEAIIRPTSTQLLIVRILEGQVGLAVEQGKETFLDVGTHVFNNGTTKIRIIRQYADNHYFNHGPYHYLRVPRGQFAKVWVEVETSLVPRLLTEGQHYIKSNLFRFVELVNASDQYIEHGSVHIISVPKGKVAKVFHDNKPRLLGEGNHIVESIQFEYRGMENIVSNLCIVHGTITILRVTLGSIALAWSNNEPLFLDQPGLYEFDSNDFSFVEFKLANERMIQLGAKKILLVYTGEVAVTYDQGELRILKDGRHLIESSTHVFHSFLSTQQKSIRLITLDNEEKMSRKSKQFVPSKMPKAADYDLAICETKDLVKVGVRADVFYSIEDPEKCIKKIDPEELEDLVRETAVATLTNIIRSTTLNEIAVSQHVSAGVANEVIVPVETGEDPEPSAPLFFDKAHDEFMSKLHDDFMQRYGVDIANIRIESFKIMDTELSDSISKHALTTAQIENELANLEGKSLISTQKERTAAEIKNINAMADASAMKTKMDAENLRMIEAAQAEAEALKIAAKAKAEAESEAILTKAKAEAEAIRLKASAEADRASALSRTKLGQQECLLGIYSDMVKDSNQGVEKVIYLDPSVNKDSPFALGSLQNLNRDLHSLSQLGIASDAADAVPEKTVSTRVDSIGSNAA